MMNGSGRVILLVAEALESLFNLVQSISSEEEVSEKDKNQLSWKPNVNQVVESLNGKEECTEKA